MTDRDIQKDRLKEIVKDSLMKHIDKTCSLAENITNDLLANGVIVTPCVAMVEQFLKDGQFDRKRTAHNGRIAVVYIDKSKWNSPLIDITEQFYNTDKAVERIQALKEREGK